MQGRTKRRWFLFLVLGAGTTLMACGGGDDGGTAPGAGTGTAIGPAGGTATASDGGARIVVPPGALAAEVELTVGPANSAPAGCLDGTAYTCGPAGTAFSLPITLTIAYDPLDLPPGTPAARLRLATDVGGAWVPLAGAAVDSVAQQVSAPVSHFSTFGVTVASPAASAEAHLVDAPAAQNEFATLVEALAWLGTQVGYEDQGVLHWRTDTAQEAASLAWTFDLRVEVEAGRTPVLRAADGGSLVIDAAGACDLSGFTIEAGSGLVLNANRAVNLSGCTLPNAVVNVGGVAGAPFPAAEPGYAAKSSAAAKAAAGATVVGNVFANSFALNHQGAAGVSGDYVLQDNSGQTVSVGGPAPLIGGEIKVCTTPAAPSPLPLPYPVIAKTLDGDGKLTMSGLKGVKRLELTSTVRGTNQVKLEKNEGDVAAVALDGPGLITMNVFSSKIKRHTWFLEAATARVHCDSLQADEVNVSSGGIKSLADATLDLDRPQVRDLLAVDFTTASGATIAVDVLEPDLQGGFHCFVPAGGDVTVTVQGGTVSGGSLWIGPNRFKAVAAPRRSAAATGSITLADVEWSSGELDHVEVWEQDVPVTVSGCTFAFSGDPALALGLTEIGGAISVTDNTLTNLGLGLVDCTGAATVDGNDITVTASTGYGISVGGSAAIDVSDCSIVCSGGASGIITGMMNGDVSVTGSTIVAPTLALLAGESDVTADDNAQVTGLISVVGGSLHFANNTCSGVQIIDDYVNPGLQNDPVADNDGVLPGMVMTRMDWDGNGCCDYPPEWNVQDEHGACIVCAGVGGKTRWP